MKDLLRKNLKKKLNEYNRYPLLDSIYIKSLQKRFIRKCKSKLYIVKYNENVEMGKFDI